MNRRLFPLFVLTVLASMLLLSTTAAAQPFDAEGCYVGPGLAATLLFPYFEVDLGDPLGVGTLLAINNGIATSTIARLVMWTDWGIPTLAFDIFLKPFDTETINVGDLFSGNLPSTGAGSDLSSFLGCDKDPPTYPQPALSADQQLQLVADHLGLAGPTLACGGSPQPDQVARGYITVDVVAGCSGRSAGNPGMTPRNSEDGYFFEGGEFGTAIAFNALWGDIIYVDFNDNSAQGSEAVPIWANPERFEGTDRFTFYGRFSNWDGRDERVPLPSVWDQRFLNGGPFAGGADLIVWRDPGVDISRVPCGLRPIVFPLPDRTLVFDLDGNTVLLGDDDNFPLATQRVSVGSLAIPFDFGWMQIQLGAQFGLDPGASQAWVQPSLNASGLFSANFNATPADFLCDRDPTPVVRRTGSEEAAGMGPAVEDFSALAESGVLP